MTSSGDVHCWGGYGAVSAAKCALESHIRQLAFELMPLGITANSLRAGVTDTAALRKIPGSTEMIEVALRKTPTHRLTTPLDVARCLTALARPETQWMTGNVINVDGGEEIGG
jgi:NAD(P)-dependent dehydrogenase (short-subunit alcohol dehydrogenase family)